MVVANIILFLSIVNFIATLLLFLNVKKDRANISFSVFSIITTAWLFNNFLLIAQVHNMYPLSYGFSILVATSALVWVYHLVGEKIPKFILFFVLPLSAIFFFIVSFTNFVVGPILKIETFGYEHKIGFLFLWHFLYIGVLITATLYKLFRKFLTETENLKKKQLISIFSGGVIFVSISYIVNFITPFFFGNTSFVKIVNLAFFPFLALIVYSIFKHQLFGIKIMFSQFMVAVFLALFLLNFLFSNSSSQYYWNGFLMLVSAFFSYFVIRSMFKEIELSKRLLKEAQKDLDFEKRLRETFGEIAEEKIKRIEEVVLGKKNSKTL